MIDLPDFRRYLDYDTRDGLLVALADICESIATTIQEVATAESAELQQRIDGWQHSRENSLKAQEMAGTVQSAAAKQTLIDRKADLAILTEVKWFLLRLLDGDSRHGSDRSP